MKPHLMTMLVAALIVTFVCVPSALAEESLSLAGMWRFSRDDSKAGINQKWYAGDLKTTGGGPSEISLPGTTDEAKAGVVNPKPPDLGGLYRPNTYTGPAWYQREIDIPNTWKGKHVTLFLERNHWVTHGWLDGKDLGSRDSLIAPQIYDLGLLTLPGKHRLTICVDNTLKINLGEFVSINYEGTQTNWNGIVGAIELRAADPLAIDDVQVYPDVDKKLIKVEAQVTNLTGSPAGGEIHFSVNDEAGAAVVSPVILPVSGSDAQFVVSANIPMGDHPKLWDEFSPSLYSLKALLTSRSLNCRSEKSVSFGMRELSTKGTQFLMNGRPLMLRGTLECAIFPLTGYPPTDTDSWRRIFQIEKSYGLNFLRFHSWCPPEAAFTAADQEGVILQVEGDQANVPAGKDPQRDDFVEHELMRIIHTYGNHPSFCLMSLGNEYGGSVDLLTHWDDMLIHGDPRHLYSSASNNKVVTANRQWTTNTMGRGVHGPQTDGDLRAVVARQDRPILGHEIGQWTFYPNFDEIKKYTGVLQATNFELIRNDLAAKGMADEGPQFFQATGRQAVLLYKEEIEELLRTPNYAGFSLLDLHDYPGQGTALVGLLDPFWDSKGFITPEEHRRYCGATVPLLRMHKRTYTSDEMFSAKVQLAHFGPKDLPDAQAKWEIKNESGKIVAEGSLPTIMVPTGMLSDLGEITTPLNRATAPSKLTVVVSLRDTAYSNSWNIWVYPNRIAPTPPISIVVSHGWDEATRAALAKGGRVILFPDHLNPAKSLRGAFRPVFWSPVWFHRNPDTMGILCDPQSPLFSQFPTEFHSDWQWWNLIEGSRTMILNDTPAGFRPLVQVIDNFARNDKLGNVFQTRFRDGRLLVCTLNLGAGNSPEAAQFLKSLYAYAASDSFAPTQELDESVIDRLFVSPTTRP